MKNIKAYKVKKALARKLREMQMKRRLKQIYVRMRGVLLMEEKWLWQVRKEFDL